MRKVLTQICFISLIAIFSLASVPSNISAVTQDISEKQLELAGDLFDYTGRPYQRFMVEKLMKFNFPDKCWEKALGKDGWGPHSLSFVTGDLTEWFKASLGYTALYDIEGSGVDIQKENRPRVLRELEQYRKVYFLDVDATECDCNTTTSELVSKYTGYVGSFPYRERFVPKSGVYFVHLKITPKVKDISANVSKDGKDFYVTAPAEVEPPAWSDKVQKVFSRAGKDY